MKIEIKESNLKIDDKKVGPEAITTDLLEDIIDKGVLGKVEINIDKENESPMALLFRSIKETISDKSDFRKELEKLEKQIKREEADLEKEHKKLESADDSSNNNIIEN